MNPTDERCRGCGHDASWHEDGICVVGPPCECMGYEPPPTDTPKPKPVSDEDEMRHRIRALLSTFTGPIDSPAILDIRTDAVFALFRTNTGRGEGDGG